ncbi:DnaJ-domain-containing protein [Mollisia scopiformis]|uniref:DnaJ-domain-containing protein n=1 Tax=Mollisia scopiformis TaxID=149040 RepID=A0A194XFM0_MOLSC|nr:DnaJ-domain-containing protein [Mollisia scopiformis]KUJ18941.1 DnaJ-domain-containing protein [Mollisia scopiformis]
MPQTSSGEDYYMVLEVVQTATPEQINRSYKRLALKLHPDRNTKHDATEAFQLLGRAYETLKDESKRRSYDLIYPSLARNRPTPQTTQTPRPTPTSNSQPGALSEAAQIAALRKSKQERAARWQTKKTAFDSSLFELRKDIRRLEQQIKNLDSITAAEAAEEAQKNSWGTWLLSPIYKKAEVGEEEKACNSILRQERRIEKDMKERRLGLKKADLEKEENRVKTAKGEIDAADSVDERKIRVIEERIKAREMQEKERVERERQAKIWKQQQEERERQAKIWKQQQEQQKKREQEAAEALRKQQAEQRAAEQKRQEEQARMWQKILDDQAKHSRERYPHLNSDGSFTSSRKASTSTFRHDGWWPKMSEFDTAEEAA